MVLQGSATCRPSATSRCPWLRRNDRAGTTPLRQYPSQKVCSRPHSDENGRRRRSPRKKSVAAASRPASSPDEAEGYPQIAWRSASLASWDANPPDWRYDTTRIAPPSPPATPVSSARHLRSNCLLAQRPALVPAQPQPRAASLSGSEAFFCTSLSLTHEFATPSYTANDWTRKPNGKRRSAAMHAKIP